MSTFLNSRCICYRAWDVKTVACHGSGSMCACRCPQVLLQGVVHLLERAVVPGSPGVPAPARPTDTPTPFAPTTATPAGNPLLLLPVARYLSGFQRLEAKHQEIVTIAADLLIVAIRIRIDLLDIAINRSTFRFRFHLFITHSMRLPASQLWFQSRDSTSGAASCQSTWADYVTFPVARSSGKKRPLFPVCELVQLRHTLTPPAQSHQSAAPRARRRHSP